MALCGALRLRWSPVTPRHFAWQAWRLVTSTFVSRGRRGAISHRPSFHVAGVAQSPIHLRFAWQVWHNLTSTFVLCGRRGTYGTVWRASSPVTLRHFAWQAWHLANPPSFRVAGVAQSHIHLRFAYQAWHNLTSTFVLRGKRGTYGTVWRAWSPLVAGNPAALCVAGVALGDIHLRFSWQA